jgi:hypothetical protein
VENRIRTAARWTPDAAFISEAVTAAYEQLLRRDRPLLRVDSSERSISHKLAQYLEPYFPGWHVDCEYNRDGADAKRLLNANLPVDFEVRACDVDGATTLPDIIVHKRGRRGPNLLVVEVKKSHTQFQAHSRYWPDDESKVRAFVNGDRYGYQYGCLVVIPVNASDQPKGDIRILEKGENDFRPILL